MDFSNEMANIINSHQSQKSCRKNKKETWGNTRSWLYQGWGKVSRTSEHPLSTGHTRCEPSFTPETKVSCRDRHCYDNGSILLKVVQVLHWKASLFSLWYLFMHKTGIKGYIKHVKTNCCVKLLSDKTITTPWQ
jgi:hypothetical protein